MTDEILMWHASAPLFSMPHDTNRANTSLMPVGN
jgi:hypothetical protein